VADLRVGQGHGERQRRPAAWCPAWLRPGTRAGGWAAAARLWRGHRLFIIVAAVSLLPRVLASLAFRPALFLPDTFSYLSDGERLFLGQWHPAGYPVLLRVLEPFHSLLLVTTVQHLLGIGMAALVYAVLRHWGLPGWGSVLAAAPTLFDPRQIMLESMIAADTLYAFLVVAAVAILLTRRAPAWWQCAAAGLLIAYCSIVRGNGPAVIVAIVAFLLIRRVGWRALAAGVASFALPLAAYMTLYYSGHGTFGTSSSDGLFLWSRTMSFANCAVIRPPADLRPLCPDRQRRHPPPATPAWSVPALLNGWRPTAYLWSPRAWWRHDAHPGFNDHNNSLALRFAVDAIRAQPLGYTRTVGKEVMLTFLATDRSLSMQTLHFTTRLWDPRLDAASRRDLLSYAHTSRNTHAVQPYAYFLYLYQLPVYFPGVVFLLVVVAGLAGVIRRWRDWGGPGALPWAAAAIGIVVPVALHEYDYRFAIGAVPLACLAAGLAFARRPGGPPVLPSGEAAEAGADQPAARPQPSSPPPGTVTAVPGQCG
jgi:hypothetical protein